MYIIYILSVIPILIWLTLEPLAFRFADANAVTTSIGQVLGLLGMTLFSINLILAGRLKFLDRFFHGLDKVYKNHGRIGSLAFSFILFHPIFLVVKFVSISLRQAGLFFVPFLNMPVTWGIISLLLMIILISLTFYIKLKYNVWKISHKFMILAFAFSVLHVLTITSDVSQSSLLKYYILTLAALGIFVSVRSAILGKLLVKKYQYKIKRITNLNDDITEVEMEPVSGKMKFTPGQFAFFSFLGDKISDESHPFSLSSTLGENNLKVTIKNLGDFTSQIRNLKLDDRVTVDGPYGGFSYRKAENKEQIWIAGGIGITPFLSMAKSLDNDYKVNLFYSVKEDKEAVYQNELKELSERKENFKSNIWSSKEKGYINSNYVSEISNGLENKDIFLCGPLSFMESLKNQFVSNGVDINKIHYENFTFNS